MEIDKGIIQKSIGDAELLKRCLKSFYILFSYLVHKLYPNQLFVNHHENSKSLKYVINSTLPKDETYEHNIS
jgi:hypothetical protein